MRGLRASSAAGPAARRQSRSASSIDIVECPRDAMQGLPSFVPTEDKIRYINKLLEVGFHTVDFGSFVSAPAVPQMRDTAEVLKGLNLADTRSELLAVVCNVRGAVDAAEHKEIKYLGFPLSISEDFQQRNTRKGITEALETLQKIQDVCANADKELVTYISMAFGNPYNEAYSPDLVREFVDKVSAMGCKTISLADTVGCGSPELIRSVFDAVLPAYKDTGITVGAHLHSSSVAANEKIQTLLDVGCPRIDGAVGGMGGCPFAKSALVGNVPTESIIEKAQQHPGVQLELNMGAFREALAIKHELFGVAVSELILSCYLGDQVAFETLCRTHFDDADLTANGGLSKSEFARSVRKVITELGEETPADSKIDKIWGARATPSQDMGFEEYTSLAREKILKRMEKGEL